MLEKYFAKYWCRFLFFSVASSITYLLLYFLHIENIYLYFTISLLVLSAIVEKYRINSNYLLFGLSLTRYSLKEILISFALMICSAMLFLVVYFFFKTEIKFQAQNLNYLSNIIFYIFVMVLMEELLFRGIIFQVALDKFGNSLSIIIFSLFFGLSHIFNNHISSIAIFNTILVNILLSIMYINTRSLWLPVSYHFFWNTINSLFLNSPLSGFDYGISLIKINFKNIPSILHGGNYGVESGLIASIIILATFPIIIRFTRIAPEIAAMLFKRSLAESKLMGN